VDKTLNTKIVDLTTPTTFTKSIRGFSQQILQEWLANFECHSVSVNRRYCHLAKFFNFFYSKFEMTISMKVVSLNKLDNFHKGRFLSVYVNFGERGKSSGRHSWSLGFKWGLTMTLTKG
jgi:hypothetical protein